MKTQTKKPVQNTTSSAIVLLGIISGVFGGLIVAFSQDLAKENNLDFIWVVFIAVVVLITMILLERFSIKRNKK